VKRATVASGDEVVAHALAEPDVFAVRPGTDLALTVDTLIAGVHFPTGVPVEDIGYKALAVNVSDLAAMGAVPTAALISITAPVPNRAWERGFLSGLRPLAEDLGIRFKLSVRARGALAITVFLYGELPLGQALRRSGARPGDLIYVTGTLGDAALALLTQSRALSVVPEHQRWLDNRLNRPTPRVAEGIALRGVASAAIDLSDGLSADLGHVLAASAVGASIKVSALPLSPALAGSVSGEQALRLALAGGDDYELCFSIPPQRRDALQAMWKAFDSRLTCIGVIEAQPGLRCLLADGSRIIAPPGYRHFG
jgi:thiamine-monophosphate kinase